MSEKGFDFMLLAKRYANSSRCYKVQLGSALVSVDGRVVLGHNGPPVGLGLCRTSYFSHGCPRLDMGHGEASKMCRAVHAERDAVLQCAKMGISTKDATIYCYMGRPCKDCCVELIQAGIKKIVFVRQDRYYDDMSGIVLDEWVMNGGGTVEIVEDVWEGL